jgi:mRNA interferase RelE/StbE
METFFKRRFIKDFKKLPKDIKKDVRELCFLITPKAENLNDLEKDSLKKIKGFKNYYRVRIGDYRIGFKKVKNQIIFMRVLHRKDIYKLFP